MIQIDFTSREGRRAQGKLIQEAAEGAGLSLEALARQIGCSRALIYQYVSGATLAQPDRIQQIGQITGKPLIYFYGGEAAPDNLHERLAALQALLQAQTGPPDLQGALATCEQVIALARQAGDVRAEAGARGRQAALLLQQGEAARALAALDALLPFLRQHQLDARLSAAEQNRGHALLALGRVEEADACFARVVESGAWSARWQGLVSLAAVAEHQGQYDRALAQLDDALALEAAAPDPRAAHTLRLYVLGNLANVHLACGDAATAAAQADEAIELAVQLANRDQYIEALLTLGVCRRLQGRLRDARETLESAGRWARLAEDRGREALARAELAMTLVEAGRFDDARVPAKDALQGAIAVGARRAELAAHLALAASYGRAGLPQEARYHAAQAWEISTLLGQPYAQATALVALGEAALLRGDAADADKAFGPALTIADNIGARVPALQARLGLSRPAGELCEIAHALALPPLRWPALLTCGIQAEEAGRTDEARAAYTAALDILDTLRAALAAEPEGDTYLEYPLACEPYRRLVRLLRGRGETAAAAEILARADWPPLAAALEEEPA